MQGVRPAVGQTHLQSSPTGDQENPRDEPVYEFLYETRGGEQPLQPCAGSDPGPGVFSFPVPARSAHTVPAGAEL